MRVTMLCNFLIIKHFGHFFSRICFKVRELQIKLAYHTSTAQTIYNVTVYSEGLAIICFF